MFVRAFSKHFQQKVHLRRKPFQNFSGDPFDEV